MLRDVLARVEPFGGLSSSAERLQGFLTKIRALASPIEADLELVRADYSKGTELNWSDDTTRNVLQDFYRLQAIDILARMDQKRIEYAATNIVLASEVFEYSTPFMVVQHNARSFKVRFANSVLANLQLGVESFLQMIKGNMKTEHFRIVINTAIPVYEHGHEESTIGGQILWGRRSWLTYLKHEHRVELMSISILISLLVTSVIISTVKPEASKLGQFFDRLTTATLVSSLTLLVLLLVRATRHRLVDWNVIGGRSVTRYSWIEGVDGTTDE